MNLIQKAFSALQTENKTLTTRLENAKVYILFLTELSFIDNFIKHLIISLFFFKIKIPEEVGIYKSTGSANQSKVFKGPKQGLYYLNANEKKCYIKKENIDTSVEYY